MERKPEDFHDLFFADCPSFVYKMLPFKGLIIRATSGYREKNLCPSTKITTYTVSGGYKHHEAASQCLSAPDSIHTDMP